MKKLIYDYTFMLAENVGRHGIAHEQLDALAPRLRKLKSKLLANKPSFTRLPYDQQAVQAVQQLIKQVSSQFENLIVLGIGGSDLGARAVINALTPPFRNFSGSRSGLRVFFLGGNTDPDEIAGVLSQVDLAKTAINIISKSGDTIEPMSAFVFLRDALIKVVGQENHVNHIIATTDAAKGTMREITDQWGYRSLIVPQDVGGRFSVLSTVGLFPAACASVDIESLLVGAATMNDAILSRAVIAAEVAILEAGLVDEHKIPDQSLPPTRSGVGNDKNKVLPDELDIAQMYAALHYLGYIHHHQNIHIVMPYTEHLRQFGFWYRQLWAESLGKKENVRGQTVNVGPTPVAALGATDQHSQMQLYNEGPFDKLITFIRVEAFDQNFTIPQPRESESHLGGVTYMAGHNFAEIINAEAKASAIALAMNGRPSGTIILPELTAHTLGELLMLFEWATAYMGELLEINAYDQPGVEAGKTAMYALLGRKGFEERRKELEKLKAGRYVI